MIVSQELALRVLKSFITVILYHSCLEVSLQLHGPGHRLQLSSVVILGAAKGVRCTVSGKRGQFSRSLARAK